jgi:Plasmid encoded RepA protein
MFQHETPNEQLRTLLVLKLGARLWSEVERWPKEEQPKDLTQDAFFEYILPYANALSWLRHLNTQEGSRARMSITLRAFGKEGDHDPESDDIDPVKNALGPRLAALNAALDLENLSAQELLCPTATKGMWSLDASAVQYLEAEGLKESAEWVKKQSKDRWKSFQLAQGLDSPRSHLLSRRALWWLWESEELEKASEPPLVLAHFIGRGLVKAHKKNFDATGWNQAARIVNLNESRHLQKLSLGFCAREFVLCGLPYKPTKAKEFVRQNGNLRLKVWGDPTLGIPFGQDRLIPIWLASAFQAAGQPAHNRIYFRSASDLLRAFEIPINGRERQLLRERLQRVFSATYQIELKEKQKDGSIIWNAQRYQLITRVCLWFKNSEKENQYTLENAWRNYIDLDPYFAQDLRKRSLPIDLDTIIALKRSPALMDYYAWLAWRSYGLLKSGQKEARVPILSPHGYWAQSGSSSTDESNIKEMMRRRHAKLLTYWPECPSELTSNAEYIIVRPGMAIHQGASFSIPGVSRKPPLRTKREPSQPETNQDMQEQTKDAEVLLLERPPGQDPFPEDP